MLLCSGPAFQRHLAQSQAGRTIPPYQTWHWYQGCTVCSLPSQSPPCTCSAISHVIGAGKQPIGDNLNRPRDTLVAPKGTKVETLTKGSVPSFISTYASSSSSISSKVA